MNLAICKVSTILQFFNYTILLVRITFGPFPEPGLVFYHYLIRAFVVSFLVMLSFKNILKIFFLIDFERMSSVPEKYVMVCMSITVCSGTFAHLAHEAVVRSSRQLKHYGRSEIFTYLGKVSLKDLILGYGFFYLFLFFRSMQLVVWI